MFQLGVPAGSIVDLVLDLVLADLPSTTTPVTTAVATATIGVTYYLALDGPSTNDLVPVSLFTTH